MADSYDDYYTNISRMDRNLHQYVAGPGAGPRAGGSSPRSVSRLYYQTVPREAAGYPVCVDGRLGGGDGGPSATTALTTVCYAEPLAVGVGAQVGGGGGGYMSVSSDSDYSSQDSTISSSSSASSSASAAIQNCPGSRTATDRCYHGDGSDPTMSAGNHDNQSYDNGYVHLPSYQKYDPNA